VTTLTGAPTLPACTQLLPADAPRPQWLKARKAGLGGSDASTIAGVNPYSSRYALWLDKTGRATDEDENAAMRWGKLLEPAMRTAFTEDTGIAVHSAGLQQSTTRPWQLLSPDGITADGGLFESKTAGWRVAKDWDDQVADHAEVQVQHGLAVTGLTHAWVVALIDGRDFRVHRVNRDDELIRVLTDMEETFWTGHVLADTPPGMEATALDAVKGQYPIADESAVPVVAPAARVDPLLAEYRAGKAAEKAGKDRAATAEAALRLLLGDATALAVGDRTVATCRPVTTRRLDSKRLRADHPGLADTYTNPTTHRRFTIKEN